jgi:hypothetical protein
MTLVCVHAPIAELLASHGAVACKRGVGDPCRTPTPQMARLPPPPALTL